MTKISRNTKGFDGLEKSNDIYNISGLIKKVTISDGEFLRIWTTTSQYPYIFRLDKRTNITIEDDMTV